MQNSLKNLEKLRCSDTVRIVGMMTGTSADGLDLCLVEFSGTTRFPTFEVLESTTCPLPSHFSDAFKRPLELTVSTATNLSFRLGEWYAKQLISTKWKFDLIASHGQTLVHAPPQYTLQIGEPGFMAEQLKTPVVFDFRSQDVVLGGQGAPLIPVVDEFLFRDETEVRAALNIGGIANITLLPTKADSRPVIAWDTGPGNTLIDRAMATWTQGAEAFDRDGAQARKGVVNESLLDWLNAIPYCSKMPPKSAGQEQFGIPFFNEIFRQSAPKSDRDWQNLMATLTEFTVESIAREFRRFEDHYPTPTRLFIGGGGASNVYMMERLQHHLPTVVLEPVNLSGITSDNKEAFGFAYLGYLWLRQLPGNLPAVTGAKHAVILGKLCM